MSHYVEEERRRKKKKRKKERTMGVGRVNKRPNSKVESNNSPEIPDRGETSDIPGLSLGALQIRMHT